MGNRKSGVRPTWPLLWGSKNGVHFIASTPVKSRKVQKPQLGHCSVMQTRDCGAVHEHTCMAAEGEVGGEVAERLALVASSYR